jgi:hypothetical protein
MSGKINVIGNHLEKWVYKCAVDRVYLFCPFFYTDISGRLLRHPQENMRNTKKSVKQGG